MPDIGGIAGDRLRSFIERIERLEEEKLTLSADIKEVYAEAKGTGFDTKTMRQIVKERRMDKADLDEQETLLDLYRRALGMLSDTPLGEAAIGNIKSGATKAARKFVDAVAKEPGESVSLTGPDGSGVRISNKGGRKTVEPIPAKAEAPAP